MIEFFLMHFDKLLIAILVHVKFVLISVFFGSLVAITFGVLLSRYKKLSNIFMPLLGVFQTIPGLVFIGFLAIAIGFKDITIIIALSIYSIFPILKNTYTGLLEVDNSLIEAAKGCGMSPLQRLFKVELALASDSIVAGIKMATIYTISWAVLAAMIGLGGLGEFVYRGIETNNPKLIILGAIPSALLAILFGYLIDLFGFYIKPKGLRKRA